MDGKKFLIVGGGGREAIFAARLAEDSTVCAMMPHENPTICDAVGRSGGRYRIGDILQTESVLSFAREVEADYAFVNADDPLANGTVDRLLDAGIRTIGPRREAARIEWDKVYSMGMVQRLCPEYAPFHRIVSDKENTRDAISEFESRGLDVVVKPRGLTGGKGVRVMPEHLPGYRDAEAYATTLLDGGDKEVLMVERLDGIEFTIMGITDGSTLVMAPATYDYPYRCEGDTGAGTGGMGCFAGPDAELFFMDMQDTYTCRDIMQRVIDDMRARNLGFNGVLNGGFFKTRDGIRFMEFNSRFGDPEVLNVLGLFEGSFSGLLKSIWEKRLAAHKVSFLKKASVSKYLVAAEYPGTSPEATVFEVDEEALERLGVRVYHASCIRTKDGTYETLKRSRATAFCALGESPDSASDIINGGIDAHVRGGLEYRRDVGSRQNIERIRKALPESR